MSSCQEYVSLKGGQTVLLIRFYDNLNIEWKHYCLQLKISRYQEPHSASFYIHTLLGFGQEKEILLVQRILIYYKKKKFTFWKKNTTWLFNYCIRFAQNFVSNTVLLHCFFLSFILYFYGVYFVVALLVCFRLMNRIATVLHFSSLLVIYKWPFSN